MANIIPSPLYRSDFEHDACGVGFIANMHGTKSNDILSRAVVGLKNLAHRGAIDADAITGDGAGILTQIPYSIFRKELEKVGKNLFREEHLAVCAVFLPLDDEYGQAQGRRIIEESVKAEGLHFAGWRECPVDNSCLGKKAELTRPLIMHGMIMRNEEDDATFERKLLLAQKASARRAEEDKVKDFYIVSMSHKTITYKGLLNAPQVRKFFLDFQDESYETAFAIFHQRFATNTFPDWTKAQPYRMLAHNGEINTIRGNRNAMRAREYSSEVGVWGDRYKDLSPMVQQNMSDSASFDNALQITTAAGRSATHGVSIMMPSAWENDRSLDDEVRAFYKYHAVMMEPWDGPAAIVFTDGRYVAASLDRNGLRPARYKVYEDGTVILASEVGLIPEWGSVPVKAGRLGPGKMLAVDLEENRLVEDDEIKGKFAAGENYSEWCSRCISNLSDITSDSLVHTDVDASEAELVRKRVAFGYDIEEEERIIIPMADTGAEGIGSMGDDTPLAVISRKPRLIYTYFKQLFAQVTNPPIDSLRERMVMSLKTHLGGRISLFEGMVKNHEFIALESPILLDHEFETISQNSCLSDNIAVLNATFPVSEGESGLEVALLALRGAARKVVAEKQIKVIVVSDRHTDSDHASIPTLLAVGAVHSELVLAGTRISCDIIAETAEVRDVHQTATVLGFGANAIYPYLALDLIRSLSKADKLDASVSIEQAQLNYRYAIDKGILKIMSKMGISTLFSYQGAGIFEAVGISQKVIDDCFSGTACPIDGIGYAEIASEVIRRHTAGFEVTDENPAITSDGYFSVVKKGEGEFHGWNPKVVSGMNRFNRKGGDYEAFQPYKDAADDHQPVSVKDLLKINYPEQGVDIDKVEPIDDIRSRFTTAGMSLGALSPEMHESLAIAMNSIGGKSNSGEGGEDPKRFSPYDNGDNANSAIKQVASGRFGVSAEYLANAREIEIKIAQGAKPGEGGQLPGHKVSPLIASLRYSVPGVTLISPPPHHDIYSIEDLAQLIFDLKEVNPRAKVCVKLVSSSGVGTIAAGVAKAYSDVILISGHDGGTGASPLSSIKHAGSAWEIGLAETHQTLMMNDLRGRVTLRTDGGMKTGRDIVIAALLGAEEFNFGTSALIAGGCAMFRVCHLNSCPVGVATQRDDLRAKFRGKPEYIVNYFNAVAEDVRRILAKLGARTLNDIIGRTEFLEQIEDPENPKTSKIDFKGLLHNPDPVGEMPRYHTRERNDRFGSDGSLDDRVMQEAKESIVHMKKPFRGSFKVNNISRNVGTHLAGEIAYLHGNKGMKSGTITLDLKGSAGQSFGTFLVQGLRLNLTGEANDYVGKGMNGGEIIIRPKAEDNIVWSENVIIGNTCLYGATGGHLFAAGTAGERFGVRNSGGTAVVEGVGDHGCEYMTGGTIIILGETGRNFGAGMSGGLAFIYDENDAMAERINPEMVELKSIEDVDESIALKAITKRHAELTGSPKAKDIINNWERSLGLFKRVTPFAAADVTPPVFRVEEGLNAITV